MTNPLTIDGVRVPPFLYGTAWKEEATQRLTELALQQGFRGIDTANQRRHYHEAGAGLGIKSAIASGHVTRDELFLQTKYTLVGGQDHRLPYDPAAPIGVQVEQSLASSLAHLGVERIDSFLLHGPTSREGLAEADWDAWRAIEAVHDSGRVRLIGVSNFSLDQLHLLCQQARIQPRFVQNRYASTLWDRRVREFCTAKGIAYQGFSLLTANRNVLARPEMAQLAQRHARTIPQIVFRFALHVGMIPLTGTTDAEHMQHDLDVLNFRLSGDEIERIESLAVR